MIKIVKTADILFSLLLLIGVIFSVDFLYKMSLTGLIFYAPFNIYLLVLKYKKEMININNI